MTSFGRELLGDRGFSLIPPEGLHAVISTHLRLLRPTKSMVAYARKQSRSAIFKWQEKEKGWYFYADEFPPSWEKKVKVVNLPKPTKKGSMSRTAKSKSAKKGDDSSETCSDLVPYKEGIPPIGNIVLKSSPPPSTRTHSSRYSTVSKPKPSAPRPSVDDPPSTGPMAVKEKHLHQHHLPLPSKYVIYKFYPCFILVIYRAFLRLTLHVYIY